MNFPSIRIEGAILSPDILDRIEDAPGQKPADFGLEASSKVKDEIARAWADAQDYWRIFQRKLDAQKLHSVATTETRQQWIVPLLGLLGYQLEYQSKGAELNGKTYAISHRAINRAQTPVHIVGYRDPAGLDRKPDVRATGRSPSLGGSPSLRMSPHAMVQEYINLHEQLYGIVTNGRVLRLLRDSSRLVKLSYLEFDLDRIFTDGLFADFAILYRLLHATRLPVTSDTAAESLIERYHQDSLDSGARIRDGLSHAVEQAIRDFGNGFLAHPANTALRDAIADGTLSSETYYKHLLNLIYRLLFLMVIEERGLIFPPAATAKQREIYRRYYSVQRLRLLSEKRYLADPRRHDHWLALTATFRLFEAEGPGAKLGLAPLAGDLFGFDAIGLLSQCLLGNDVLLGCLRSLSLYEHPDNRQLIRVNYAALNVEEFGSVYEGLLEYEPVFLNDGSHVSFDFTQMGEERAATGSHYTPDELVQPLIKHSLDYLIADKLKEKDPEKALLALRIADISCGSGHILLAAARRVATELATVRTGEEQPSPTAYRAALRDTIRECIYGVDLNPLAVELCKVALWLEAHNPGQPLNFLDHHIKCGNSIVGLAHEAELQRGISDDAFNRLPDDDKDVATQFRKRNKVEKEEQSQQKLDLTQSIRQEMNPLSREYAKLAALPDHSPTDYRNKKAQFEGLGQRKDIWRLRTLANLQVAQFFIPKTQENIALLCTEEEYRDYLNGKRHPQSQAVARANALAVKKHWFHWFIEFPDIFEHGGFDCILGNPPYLGGRDVSLKYGSTFFNYVHDAYAPAGGLCDLVAYFLRRIFALVRKNGFLSTICTKTISEGDTRQGGLEVITNSSGVILFAISSVKWPGRAALDVALLSICKGEWIGPKVLNSQNTKHISTFLDADPDSITPYVLSANSGKCYKGSEPLGDGFYLSEPESSRLLADPKNKDVIYPYLSGDDLNTSPTQSPSRWVINFYDWPIMRAQQFESVFAIVEEKVKPGRMQVARKARRDNWWLYGERAAGLYKAIANVDRVLVTAYTSKMLSFSILNKGAVFSNAIVLVASAKHSDFSLLQSNLHEIWARKYSSTLGSTLRYTPSDVFETFPFPPSLGSSSKSEMEYIGERYHEHRHQLMLMLKLGLTKTYNLFHDRELSVELVAKESKQPHAVAKSAVADLKQLRAFHVQMDEAVLAAYGWHQPSDAGPAIALRHDFYEVDYLPENDRVRFIIHPDARKEILKRLIALNHARAAEEAAKSLAGKPVKRVRAKRDAVSGSGGGMVVLPKEWRYTLTPDVYAYRMIQQLVRASGGVAAIREIARAYAVLSEGTLVNELAADKDLAGVATEWAAAARQPVALEVFMPALKALIDAEFIRWHGKGLDGTLELTDDARELHPVEDDAWIVADSTLALLLTSSLPAETAGRKPFTVIEWIVSNAA